MSSSVESDILIKYRDRLHNEISGSIITLSVKATTANLLTTEEQERCTIPHSTQSEQANQFVQYITHKVNNDPSTLVVFIKDVLGKEEVFSKLAHEMLAALNNIKKETKKPVQETGSEQTGESCSGFSESLSVRSLSDWLVSENLSRDDSRLLRDQQVSGSCFLDLTDEEMKEIGLSFGGRRLVLRLQDKIKSGGAGQTTSASTKTLEITHLRYLVNETWDARNKWTQIGRDVGIDPATLDSIATAKRDKADECYPEMLSVWLRRDGATWETLLEVLTSSQVGYQQVAAKVRSLPVDKKRKIGYC